MKINKVSPSGLSGQDKKSVRSKEKVSGASFEHALKRAKNSYLEGKSVSSLAEPAAIQAPLSVMPVQLSEGVLGAMSAAEDALSNLEEFGELLSMSSIEIDRLEILADKMDKTAQKLENMVAILPENSGLRTVLEQISTLTAKEVAKFQRGDYTV